MDWQRIEVLAGAVGPALFVATFTIEGWLRPGYHPVGMFISELSLGPRGFIQILNFVVLGLLTFAFAGGVAAEFHEGRASRTGPILLAMIGISFVASGVFVMDPILSAMRFVPVPEQISWHAQMHGFFGNLIFSLAPVSCFVFLRRFRVEPRWRWFQPWTLAAGIISAGAVILMAVGPARPPARANIFNESIGLIQRTAIVPWLGWQLWFASELQRSAWLKSSPQAK